jgi:ribose/xylose/arabinose/galactoside ABC-type transport system permease subunit
MNRWRHLDGPHVRPFAVLAACIILLAVVDGGHGRFFSAATAYSTLQIFATISLVTLGLGLTMMIREFDLSVVGMYGMAGCIAVLTGTHHPWLGLCLALAIGLTAGIVQGVIIVRLHLSSVGVTLGGLLVFVGIAFVLTESRSLPYDNLDVALVLNERIAGVFSIRSVVPLAFFAGAAAIFAWTRLGRDIIAIGSDRRAAMTAGVKVETLMIGVFAFSGLCAALSGALLSYSLASASPAGLSDVIAPAAAGAILGGVSLGGGSGRPLGIAAGALTLAVLRSGLNAVGAPPFVNDITMGAVLLTVAILDGPYLARRLIVARRLVRPRAGVGVRRSA